MQEVENVLRIFKETRIALKKEDPFVLSDLSNQTINTASRTQDPDNIAVAVVIYSLGKIIGRSNYRSFKDWKKFYKGISELIDKIIESLKKNDYESTREHINQIRELMNSLSDDFKKSIQDVFRKASINKASKIYEHGISMETTGKLLGITMFELASYAGQFESKEISTYKDKSLGVKERIKLAERMFE